MAQSECIAAPLGYWSAGDGTALAPCNAIQDSSPLIGYSQIGMNVSTCASGAAYQAIGVYDSELLNQSLPAEGTPCLCMLK